MFKRIICTTIIFTILFTNIIIFDSSYAQNQILTLDDAIKIALENSFDIQNVKMERVNKQIAKNQAYEAIADVRKNESTVKFSLLFNIKFPQKHGMPKEIDLILKVPKIEKDILVLNRKIEYEHWNIIFKTKLAYYKVLLENYRKENYKTRLEDMNGVLAKIDRQVKTGIGDEKDLKFIKSEYEKLKTKYKTSVTNLEDAKWELGNLIGIDIATGYDFDDSALLTVDIQRDELEKIIDFGITKDLSVYMAKCKMDLAIRDTNEIRSIYVDRFGSKVAVLESQLSKKKIDVDTFYEKYNQALDNIARPWKSYYVINLLFFKIKIPLRWFQGKFDGLRYFEDEKYALFLSVMERNKAIAEEEQARTDYYKKIKASFSTLKMVERLYNDLNDKIDIHQSAYESKLRKNKIGLISFTDLERDKIDYYNSVDSLYEAFIEYNNMIATFDFETCGYISSAKSSGGIQAKSLESGDSHKNQENSQDGKFKYYVINQFDGYKFIFGVILPDDVDITHYELYTDKDVKIGQRTAITKTLSSIPIVFDKVNCFYVKFYKGDKLMSIGKFDGNTQEGNINIVSGMTKLPLTVGMEVGKYYINKNIYSSDIAISIKDNLKYDKYNVYYKGKLIGQEIDNGNKFNHISSMADDIANIEIEIINDDKSICRLILVEGKLIIKSITQS